MAGDREIPDGRGLAADIVKNFLLKSHEGLNLKEAYDLACSRRSVRELQKYLRDYFVDFQPTAAHLLIPHLPWAGIVTTNYDLLVERAYEAAGKGDDLVVVSKDGGRALDSIPKGKTVYLKLHGCLTEYEDVSSPLITSTEQILDHRNGRANIFKTFLEWGQNYSIVFVGYGMNDDNIRSLIQQLINEGDRRPRHYLVRPTWDEVYSDYWKERRFETINGTLEDLTSDIRTNIPKGTEALGFLAKASRTTSLSRFIAHAGVRESDHLVDALGTIFEHVEGTSLSGGSAQAFYAGNNQDWFPIENDLDFKRPIAAHITRRCIIRPPPKDPQFFLIKGHAGSGKSVLLRRLAWDTAKTYDRLVLFLRAGQQIDMKALEEVEGLTNVPVYLFVDDAAEHVDDIRHLLDRAAVREWRLVIIGAERPNEWNSVDVEGSVVPNGEFTVEYLTQQEIEDLVLLLEEHKSLGELAELSVEGRIEAFAERAGRQLLVALHEATQGISFEDILENEYDNISPLEAKALYLDICALHRFGPPVRAGLISRLHGISFDEFSKRFHKPLESVVITKRDRYTGDLEYEARHNYIAEVVFYRAAKTPEERQEIILRILDKINLDYSYDEIVLFELIKAKNLADLLPKRRLGTVVYEAAERSVGRIPRLLHQWGLYEMRLAKGSREALDRAEELIRDALKLSPTSQSIRHTLSELALRRSGLARTDLEAAALRQEAGSLARKLAKDAQSSHAHHTVAKVALATLEQALKEDTERATDLTSQAVNQAIQDAEAAIRTGLNRFPNDSFLLSAEADLAGKLKNAERALKAMERAFVQNPKSELVANKLVLLYLARGDTAAAVAVLQKALALNPGSPQLNFRYALTRMRSEPGVDIDQPDIILNILKRSLQKGAKHVGQQFWYGRQLYLAGRETEGQKILNELARLKMPSEVRDTAQATVLNKDGTPREFYGEVSFVEPLSGLISQTNPSMKVYYRREGPLLDNNGITVGRRVKYNLSFNTRGPVAINISGI